MSGHEPDPHGLAIRALIGVLIALSIIAWAVLT